MFISIVMEGKGPKAIRQQAQNYLEYLTNITLLVLNIWVTFKQTNFNSKHYSISLRVCI